MGLMTYATQTLAVADLASSSLELAEDYIDALPAEEVDDDAKAALWLLAWSYVAPAMQRAHALELVGELPAAGARARPLTRTGPP